MANMRGFKPLPPRKFKPVKAEQKSFYRVLRKLCRRRLVLAENFGPEILSAKVYRKRLYRIAPNVKARVIFEVGS